MLPDDELARLPVNFGYDVEETEQPRFFYPVLYWLSPLVGGILGYRQKPALPFVQRVPSIGLGLAVGAFLGVSAQNLRMRYQRIRDHNVKEYIRLHPELFDVPPPPYYRDVLEPWHPTRIITWKKMVYNIKMSQWNFFRTPASEDIQEEVEVSAESRERFS
ncbi:uncharacterized protein LOC106160928 [Lingula anatina]|uniref:Uncharacterized protein LOC106160928 n=1 Tax=Lingula anatina TaxID=7574 RepID=A0A1S3I5N9_LINAN|nr:uncharacterized protein LOC106160928 [Lingula anatina]|eukprot:XP_013393156.1 uncharacterized protein LOC106160928 [Lingula anatina]